MQKKDDRKPESWMISDELLNHYGDLYLSQEEEIHSMTFHQYLHHKMTANDR
ncbi:hypothetical protein [Halobacillus yeomjeoni]|uniref:Uncharacterized protein n=2 Tax=Halobacillus yeomjeoni TaxID=311194 RepID=A0A931MV26_9BACI|nr:hypothetical protein [Halobacillus yeomjeoni]MBH0230382.1 hypothetical protein [Halobacillus yeomjeoni]